MTREEHLAWCKKRAHEYLARGDEKNAIASMMSDPNKHEETAIKPGSALAMLGVGAMMGTIGAREFIDGFN